MKHKLIMENWRKFVNEEIGPDDLPTCGYGQSGQYGLSKVDSKGRQLPGRRHDEWEGSDDEALTMGINMYYAVKDNEAELTAYQFRENEGCRLGNGDPLITHNLSHGLFADGVENHLEMLKYAHQSRKDEEGMAGHHKIEKAKARLIRYLLNRSKGLGVEAYKTLISAGLIKHREIKFKDFILQIETDGIAKDLPTAGL